MILKRALLTIALVMGLVSAVVAQDNSPASQPPNKGQPNPAVLQIDPVDDGEQDAVDPYNDPFQHLPVPNWAKFGAYPGGDPEASTDDPEDAPAPQNPVMHQYEGGKIIVVVGNERHFAHHIGGVIPMTVIVIADDSVKLSFEPIEQGLLGADGSDFELASPALIRVIEKKDGKTVYRIDMELQSFVPKRNIPFTVDFMYAVELIPDTELPNWKRLTTPDFVVTTSNTADNGTDLLEGEVAEKRYKISWFTWPLVVFGGTLFLLWPTLVFMTWLNRVRPGRKIPPNEVAWGVFRRVFKQGRTTGFTLRHYKKIAAALRRFLNVEADTYEEIMEELRAHPDLDILSSAFGKLEDVIFNEGALDEEEQRELIDEIKKIVPKPS